MTTAAFSEIISCRLSLAVTRTLFGWAACIACLSAGAAEPPADAQPAAATPQTLFNGRDLKGWKVVRKDDFERGGAVSVVDGTIVMAAGKPATGIVSSIKFPSCDYEVTLEAQRLEGNDFFCGMTFPVANSHCTLILGGWGGGVVGISNIDGMSAVENETTDFIQFKNRQWYKVRLVVTANHIAAWVDKRQVVDVKTKDRKFSVWWEQEPMRPFGIASWKSKAALRNISLRSLVRPSDPASVTTESATTESATSGKQGDKR